ncbi:hypothetical protein L596_025165 [Steinernema carpocapsae]|uniref:Uncharacterized protein n=1 Tax=Steinernema carpocapsae TaxID=34508 RepID=A0A4V5ZYS7_STECR|nr:hypothetical protein L596_025165 [Steinernema carpocapsae]
MDEIHLQGYNVHSARFFTAHHSHKTSFSFFVRSAAKFKANLHHFTALQRVAIRRPFSRPYAPFMQLHALLAR